MKKYAYGSFENGERCVLIGLIYADEIDLKKKIRRAERDGWDYDGVYVPLKEVDDLPGYIDFVY